MRRFLDIDQLLVFFLLAVTINQMGHYLAQYAFDGWEFAAYLQAAGIDLAIWRSAWWFRVYGGKKQRRWALVGVVVFSLVSAWYNRGFYAMRAPELPSWQPWLMGAVLPAGVALLSYLKGQKDESRHGASKSEPAPSEPEPAANKQGQWRMEWDPIEPAPKPSPAFRCAVCGREFGSQQGLNAHMRRHRE